MIHNVNIYKGLIEDKYHYFQVPFMPYELHIVQAAEVVSDIHPTHIFFILHLHRGKQHYHVETAAPPLLQNVHVRMLGILLCGQ